MLERPRLNIGGGIGLLFVKGIGASMNRKVVYITPRKTKEGLNWTILPQNASKPFKIIKNKTEAISIAKDLAMKNGLGQIKIQNKAGRFQSERTYGQDPKKYIG